tara:strand:+ start:468 stop:611 length:144 start_codon:yes stop_codon:yes gene_type:complete
VDPVVVELAEELLLHTMLQMPWLMKVVEAVEVVIPHLLIKLVMVVAV